MTGLSAATLGTTNVRRHFSDNSTQTGSHSSSISNRDRLCRQLHPAVVPVVPETFSVSVLKSGYGWRCRLGCQDDETEETQYLWLDSEYHMKAHHWVVHGTTYRLARKDYDAPPGYDQLLFIHTNSITAGTGLIVFNLHRVFKFRKNNSTNVTATSLESEAQPDIRRRRIRELDKGVYQRIKADPVKYENRLENQRVNDHQRRA